MSNQTYLNNHSTLLMLDKKLSQFAQPMMVYCAKNLKRLGLSANMVSLLGVLLAIVIFICIAINETLVAILFIFLNRSCDGLDGCLARLEATSSRFGGFLDVISDLIFYASVPLGFALLSSENSFPASVLLAAFFINSGAFLAYAAVKKNSSSESKEVKEKAFCYSPGLVEGSETIFFYFLFCLFPSNFSNFAYIFATLTVITIIQRVFRAYKNF